MKVDLDIDQWQIGELREVKKLTGMPFLEAVAAASRGDGDALAALVLVWCRRDNPRLTAEMVDRLDFGEIEWPTTNTLDDDTDPTRPPGRTE